MPVPLGTLTAPNGGRSHVATRRGVSACALGLAVVHSCLVAVFSCLHSHFFGDDIVGLYQSRELPFWKYVTTPIDVHFVPLHRMVTYVLGRVAPASFVAAIVVLLSFHLLAILFLYLALETIRPSWQNAVLVSWYATHVYIGVLFTWWTSGLHRLPYLFLLAVAFYAYVKYRWKPGILAFLSVITCFVLALGFFEKALLIPLVLAGVEVGLWRGASARTRRAVVALLSALGVAGISYLAFWRHAVGPLWSSIGGGASFLLAYLKLSWMMLAQSAAGRVSDGGWAVFAILGALAAVTIARRPATSLTWLAGLVVVSICLELTGLSTPRAQLWGFVLATFSYRYYPDAMFVLVLFTAVACQGAARLDDADDANPRRIGGRPGLAAVSALVPLVCVAAMSFRTSLKELGFLYADQSRVREYMQNVASGLEPLRRWRTPLPFVEGQVPHFVNPVGGWVSQHSVLLGALGFKARFVRSARGAYRILPTGEVVFGAS